MQEQATAEHEWLRQLVGEWTFESDCNMGPDQPPMKTSGKETVRLLGELWTLGESVGGSAETGTWSSIMTLGYNPKSRQFVGTFVASMMTHLWSYAGTLDGARKVLTLDTDGPSFAGDGTMAAYQDIIEIIDANHRTLTSRLRGPDGNWQQFMVAHYYRQP